MKHKGDKLAEELLKNWTTSAINCYELNGECNRCDIPSLMRFQKCQMRRVVKELLKRLGEPKPKGENEQI